MPLVPTKHRPPTAAPPVVVRIKGVMGRRAWAFAFEIAESMRWLGDTIGEHEIVCRKARHAQNLLKLQAKDEAAGI
jgi:hypothetical protein